MIKIGNEEIGVFPLLLAPMEDVSDPPFRALCKEFGADLMYTEFISTDGLVRNAEKSVQKLDIYDYERPIGIQIFGSDFEAMKYSAIIVERHKPTLLDINYGCPVKKVVSREAGAGILKNIPKMIALTKAVIESTSLPVTVKTRLGWDSDTINIVEVAERLQDIGVQALSIHARTRTQMYKGHSDWSWISKVKNNPRIHIPVFGNGDIDSAEKAYEYKNTYDVDGIMIGRAAIGYPWIFREIKHYFATGELMTPPTVEERVYAARTHLKHSITWKGNNLGILEMRRHYASYFKGLPDIKEFRARLTNTMIFEELDGILNEIGTKYAGFDFQKPLEMK
jgi:nifR3 family TIM-barrel protein